MKTYNDFVSEQPVSPFNNKTIPVSELNIDDYFIPGTNSRSKKKGNNYDTNLPKTVFKVSKINTMSLLVVDISTNSLYNLQKLNWYRNDELEVYKLTNQQLTDTNIQL